MAVTRASKEAELQELEGAFKGTESAILVDYQGAEGAGSHRAASPGSRRAATTRS